MFGNLVASINEDFLRTIFHIQVIVEPAPVTAVHDVSYSAPSEQSIFAGVAQAAAGQAVAGPSQDQIAQAAAVAGAPSRAATMTKDKSDPYANVGRNEPCPCGSGKKYKRCHGASV